MPTILVVCNSSLMVKGCTIRAWCATVSRTCDKCPDQCVYRNAKVEFEPVGKEYHGN